MHSRIDAHHVVQRYLHAFVENSSVIVVSPDRLGWVRRQPRLAGWYATDLMSVFERLERPDGARCASTNELVIETSGTTGEPKMVRYRKGVIRDCAARIAESVPLAREREYLSLVNPRLAYGLSIMHSHLLADMPVRIQNPPFSLQAWVDLRDRLRPNSSVYLVPHQSYMLARASSSTFDGAIELIFAGAAVTQSMVDILKPSFPNATIVNMYGQAEMGPRISIGRAAISNFDEGNVGRPLPGVNVRIRAGNGPSACGAIEVQSAYRMASYFAIRDDAQLSENEVDTPSPWWPTEDIGYLSSSGDLHVVGRAAADINFLGTRVRLQQLRDIVRGVAGVLDARVSAHDHHVYGQQPAIRVLAEGVDAAIERRLRQALANAIGASAAAVLINIVDLTSLTESGKL
jgi:acyl-coenzyme A synthetase/AMP-(fatty) acid ligase